MEGILVSVGPNYRRVFLAGHPVYRVFKRLIMLMGAYTNYFEDKILGTLKGTNYSITPIYAALFSAAPGETGGGTEITGGAYARQSIAAANLSATQAGEPSIIDNVAAVSYAQATADYPAPVTHVGIMDALTLGNMLIFGALTTARTVLNGDTFKFNAGALDLGAS